MAAKTTSLKDKSNFVQNVTGVAAKASKPAAPAPSAFTSAASSALAKAKAAVYSPALTKANATLAQPSGRTPTPSRARTATSAPRRPAASKPAGLLGSSAPSSAATTNPLSNVNLAGANFFVNNPNGDGSLVGGGLEYTPPAAAPSGGSAAGMAQMLTGGGGASGYGLDDYGLSYAAPTYEAPDSYFQGWRPEFMDAFNAGRQEDARRYTDLTGASNTAGQRYDEAKQFLLKGTPDKSEYLKGYDDLYNQFQGKYADREKSADALFREQLGMLQNSMGGLASQAAAQYAAQQGRLDKSYAAAVPSINNAFSMAGGLADKYNGQGQQGVADAISAAGQMTPEQQKLMAAYADVAKSKAIDGLSEVGQPVSYGALATPFLSDAQLKRDAMSQSISDSSASAQRAYQAQLAGMMSDAYQSQQGNLNDILFNGGSMFQNMLNSRTNALSQYSNDYRGYGDSLFNMGNETSKTQIDALDRANQPSEFLKAMMSLTADAQKNDADNRQADNAARYAGQVSMYNGDRGNRADIIKQGIESDANRYGAGLNYQAAMYGHDQDLAGKKYTADQTLAGDMYTADQNLASDLGVAATRAVGSGRGGGSGGSGRRSGGSSGGTSGTITVQTTTGPVKMSGPEYRQWLLSTGHPNEVAAIDAVNQATSKITSEINPKTGKPYTAAQAREVAFEALQNQKRFQNLDQRRLRESYSVIHGGESVYRPKSVTKTTNKTTTKTRSK